MPTLQVLPWGPKDIIQVQCLVRVPRYCRLLTRSVGRFITTWTPPCNPQTRSPYTWATWTSSEDFALSGAQGPILPVLWAIRDIDSEDSSTLVNPSASSILTLCPSSRKQAEALLLWASPHLVCSDWRAFLASCLNALETRCQILALWQGHWLPDFLPCLWHWGKLAFLLSPSQGSTKPPWPILPNLGSPALEPLWTLLTPLHSASSPGSLTSNPCLCFHCHTGCSSWLPGLLCLLSHRGYVLFPEPGHFQSHLFNCMNLLFSLGQPEVGIVGWCNSWGWGGRGVELHRPSAKEELLEGCQVKGGQRQMSEPI